jgi:hypothetical protein
VCGAGDQTQGLEYDRYQTCALPLNYTPGPWTDFLISLYFSFFICKREITIMPPHSVAIGIKRMIPTETLLHSNSQKKKNQPEFSLLLRFCSIKCIFEAHILGLCKYYYIKPRQSYQIQQELENLLCGFGATFFKS